ncbi:hypothetical protein REPUB_Repub01dG0156100 [Reevesia pubescens]
MKGKLRIWLFGILLFEGNSDGDEALNQFKRIKRASFTVDQAMLTSVLRACIGLALLEVGRQIHVHMLKFDADLILNNAILDMYCKNGSLEDANSRFKRMVHKDVISWSTMIIGLAQNGFIQEALKFFDLMKVSGREHYGCIIDLLGRAGKLDEVVKLVHEMKCEPDVVTWRTLLGACRVHQNVDLAIYAAKQFLKLDPQDVGMYVLLSNIYANSQRWEDVFKIIKAMRDKGISKKPGYSWIEVNKQILDHQSNIMGILESQVRMNNGLI